MAGRQLSSSLVIQAYWTFSYAQVSPKKEEEAPAFDIAQEAVRPTVYFDTNRLRDPIKDDGCAWKSNQRSIARSQLLTNYSFTDWPMPTKARTQCSFGKEGSSAWIVHDDLSVSTLGE